MTVEESQTEERDNYIKGPEKFPLERDRWGYLPPQIQILFPKSTAKTPTLLRHGVENNAKQSFRLRGFETKQKF